MLSMRLKAQNSRLIPRLAWIANVERRSGIVTLLHGPSVEVRGNFFIEGVWNGPFTVGGFGDTDCVFGTGGIVTNESIRFVPSASTTDSLFYDQNKGRLTVSNSLPLLLASIGDRLDPHCPEYPAILESVMEGIDDYRRTIPTEKGKVRRQLYRTLNVTPDNIWESEKRMPPPFRCYDEYRNYLCDNYELIAKNARDRARSEPLEIWSSQSRGYDSPAVNAIAKSYGIDKVFTVTKSKSTLYLAHKEDGSEPNDDGGEICDALGLKCIRLNRHAYREEFDHEELYYCASHHNQDVNLKDISKHVSNVGVLLTGMHGGIWSTKGTIGEREFVDTQLRSGDIGGHGRSEIRLVVGFIHLPLPFIGERRLPDIVKITESAEMEPWRLGTSYDRPIPRRIAEEAGIPRRLFGQSKMGAVVIFCRPAVPYGRELRAQFFSYLAHENLFPRYKAWIWPLIRGINSMLMVKCERRYPLIHYAERVISKLRGRKFLFRLWWMHLDGALFCYCVNRRAKTYSETLSLIQSSDIPTGPTVLQSGSRVP